MNPSRAIVAMAAIVLSSVAAANVDQPTHEVADPGVITTRQSITPAGRFTVFDGRVMGVAFGDRDDVYVAVTSFGGQNVYRLDWKMNRTVATMDSALYADPQAIAFDRVQHRIILAGTRRASNDRDFVALAISEGERLRILADSQGTDQGGSPAIAARANSSGHRLALLPLTFNDAISLIDADTGKVIGKVRTGIAPFAAAINENGTIAYVTNWGGRFPRGGDRTTTTGSEPGADQIVVDQRGVAASGTVVRVDLQTKRVTNTIEVGLQPTALVWDQPRSRLYVANSNSDSISVIDTNRNAVVATLPIQPFHQHIHGVTPTGIAVSPDGKTLYVACGGINAVAVLNTQGTIHGLIPTAWYPNGVAVSSNGKQLAIITRNGVGSGWAKFPIVLNFLRDDYGPTWTPNPTRRYVHAYRGSLQVVDVPNDGQLAAYTTAAAEDTHLMFGPTSEIISATQIDESGGSTNSKPLPVPLRVGEPSLIDHVVYIVKENRTYDQVFGDIAKGNGDPTLELYPYDCTPNHHRLAQQFVLLDNFYANSGDSGNGHQWVTQANETPYTLWPGYEGRSYPFGGGDPLAYSSAGFIWTQAASRGKSVVTFGEYAGYLGSSLKLQDRIRFLREWKQGAPFTNHIDTESPIAGLNPMVAHDFPGYGGQIPDVIRAQIFLQHLHLWSRSGGMPNLVMIQLPADHTGGTTPGYTTPKATLADNDLALGEIVDGLSHSQFWPHMAIFIVEDDAQGGVDHVDGHRTVALAISPYIRRGAVDSTFYSQVSMLKTMELMLGLPPLSVFDMIANDMHNSFTTTPDFTPYSVQEPKVSLLDVNPPAAALHGPARAAALASEKMNFLLPDQAPAEVLNRILWHDAKGWDVAYPATHRAAFALFTPGGN